MADDTPSDIEAQDNAAASTPAANEGADTLEGGAYEIIRGRLAAAGEDLKSRLVKLNQARRETFGAIESRLLATARIATANNCVARDIVAVGESLLFGFNVQLGLRSEMKLEDVFAVYSYADHEVKECGTELIQDERFQRDFSDIYRYYKKTRFVKFAERGPHLFMVFRVGESVGDVKVFKWVRRDGALEYVDSRSDHEYRFPPQHEFEWTRATRDMHREGMHPHISIEDRLFVETVGGDLTIKVEDNTASGEGIYAEPVDDADQTLDDAEIYYAAVGNLVLLKIKPYNEAAFRYIVYSEKVQQAVRIDAIETSCVLLPEDHGIIHPRGFFLQTGERKEFESDLQDMLFERRIASPNGEDYLYVFYNRDLGTYILLGYNLIEQGVESPIVCHGYTLFENGELLYFRASDEPQKYHAVQIWQTPYLGPDFEMPSRSEEAYLFKIGNRDIVRAMAACQGVLNLCRREDTYANLYLDIVKFATDILDTYFWVGHEEAFALQVPLEAIRDAAAAAIEEFEKVVRLRRIARDSLAATRERVNGVVRSIRTARYEEITDFVELLTALRTTRGEIISLRDIRHMDLDAATALEEEVAGHTEELAARCVDFLLQEESLEPYRERVDAFEARIGETETVAEAKEVEADLDGCAADLEMLIDIVGNLEIQDTTRRTAILDAISTIYASLNRIRSVLKNRMQDLAGEEGVAEFAAQMKLLGQAIVNYLDICDTPEKCDEYLTKVMVQLEEMEGRFADFDEFVEDLTDKREEAYNAFESRKLALVESRNRKADALMRSAERILKGAGARAGTFDSAAGINGYFAGDLMIDKVRDIVKQLQGLGDSVKADDVQSRLKTIQQDALRQLKDRQELFVDGEDVIRLGNHNFNVNTQSLDLTVVAREGKLLLHLTGTDFFEPLDDPALAQSQDLWDRELVSESPTLYRAEYLAYRMFRAMREGADDLPPLADASRFAPDELLPHVVRFMAPRYAEGYVKGVHDADGAAILQALLQTHASAGRLEYHPRARALAQMAWHAHTSERKELLEARLRGLGAISKAFGPSERQAECLGDLRDVLNSFLEETCWCEPDFVDEAAQYLFDTLGSGEPEPIAKDAAALYEGFLAHLETMGALADFRAAHKAVRNDASSALTLLRDWVQAYLRRKGTPEQEAFRDEVVALLYRDDFDSTRVADVTLRRTLDGMAGNHELLDHGSYTFDFNEFMQRLSRHTEQTVPRYEAYVSAKKMAVDRARDAMRLEEFRPRVLTSFVRNRLLDRVYLPLIGDNLAKQIGAAGASKRTDLQGLLLLVSPPGYGKTTLMEYIANRLGIVFMKVNGPAIGHRVTSLDPAEAPNASAREEIEKLNLALEMGDNVMLYIDDIQHCNPEFLQKFISLCDAQRKIEGVYKGRSRTHDLRGKKVCVVMAGNPYTESGEAFRIPDMLANRADTYNLGDIIGDNSDAFNLSYLENAMTSNPVLSQLASRHPADIQPVIRIAQENTRDGIELTGNHSSEELNDYVNVMRKLLRVRDAVLAVNRAYIASAAQADDYRDEPPFKLQGSYRNMNRMAEKVLPLMNDEELDALVLDHYVNEAQTLATGAEANLLKFKKLTGRMTEEDTVRWDTIRKTFNRNQLFRAGGEGDRMGQILAQLSTFTDGLEGIRATLDAGMTRTIEAQAHTDRSGRVEASLAHDTLEALTTSLAGLKTPPPAPAPAFPSSIETRLAAETVEALVAAFEKIPPLVVDRIEKAAPASEAPSSQPPTAEVAGDARPVGGGMVPKIEVVNRVPRGMLHILRQQFKLIQEWLVPLLEQSAENGRHLGDMRQRLEGLTLGYENLIARIEQGNRTHRHRDEKQK